MNNQTDHINIGTRSGDPVALTRSERARHVYIIGGTGVGKTTLVEHCVQQDIANGDGVAIVDPHGDMAERLLEHIPPKRINDVVYFSPQDIEYPIGLNILANVAPDKRALVADEIVTTFKHLWDLSEERTPRIMYYLRNGIATLLEVPGTSLLSLAPLFTDDEYRKRIIGRVKDRGLRRFWDEEWFTLSAANQRDYVQPIITRVSRFRDTPMIRNIIGQPTNKFDMRFLMDNRRIFIANLAKGVIGEQNADLLGSMLVTKIYQSAMSRLDIAEEDRQQFFLFTDEFQNYATDAFAFVLSEARKLNLSITMSHQFLEQVPRDIRNAVLANAGTLIAFSVGAEDAEVLTRSFQPYPAEELHSQAPYKAYVSSPGIGGYTEPFPIGTFAPAEPAHAEQREKVLAWSRERYARPRAKMERLLDRFFTPSPRN